MKLLHLALSFGCFHELLENLFQKSLGTYNYWFQANTYIFKLAF